MRFALNRFLPSDRSFGRFFIFPCLFEHPFIPRFYDCKQDAHSVPQTFPTSITECNADHFEMFRDKVVVANRNVSVASGMRHPNIFFFETAYVESIPSFHENGKRSHHRNAAREIFGKAIQSFPNTRSAEGNADERNAVFIVIDGFRQFVYQTFDRDHMIFDRSNGSVCKMRSLRNQNVRAVLAKFGAMRVESFIGFLFSVPKLPAPWKNTTSGRFSSFAFRKRNGTIRFETPSTKK